MACPVWEKLHLSKKLQEWPLFNDAVVVTVSQTPSLRNIQQEIAEKLDLRLDKESIYERALLLRNRLKGEKKFLIILDDVWNNNELNLLDVGIVFESDQNGCKILLTSRFERVLRDDMCVENNFQVSLLSEDESWNWFNHIVNDSIKLDPEFQHCGTMIVKECACLPIAIVTMAHALKNRALPFWRDALGQLQRSNQSEKVYSRIKLCFDYLQREEAKSLLLLCALHKEDERIKMEYLMRYGIGLDAFEGARTLKAARDRVYSLVEELKDRCLLLNGDYSGTVKMHDVIRDVVISIAKESHMYSFRDGAEAEECLKKKKPKDVKAISLPNGFVDQLISDRLEYEQLGLILINEKKSFRIPNDFFEYTKELTVLKLSCPYLEVPPSLCFLQNLHMLCFRGCVLRDVALIGDLKNLEILDLSWSNIEELPIQIRQLTRLRLLDLSGIEFCYPLQMIHPDVISHLKRLEELYMGTFDNWDHFRVADGETSKNAGLIELKDLVNLTALDLQIPDVKMLPEDLFTQKLERYKISIGIARFLDNGYDFLQISDSRYLEIKHTQSSLVLLDHGLQMLLKRSQVLYLDGLNGLNNIVCELDKNGFPELKKLTFKNNYKIEYLINTTMEKIDHPCGAFGSLGSLCLDNLTNLEKICHGKVTDESFKRLMVIEVRDCDRLKNLLPISFARKLEKIEIIDCEMMEEILEDDDDDDDDNEEAIYKFPQLCSMTLTNVSKLRQFCSKLEKNSTFHNKEEPLIVLPLFNGKFVCFPKLKILELCGCNFMKIWDDHLLPGLTCFKNLTKLDIVNCRSLKNLFSCSMAVGLEQLYSIQISDCTMMEEIMSSNINGRRHVSFPKLSYLKLQNLSKITGFSSEVVIEFPCLTELFIQDCPEFRTFISDSHDMSCILFNKKFVSFPKLKNLELSGCNFMKIWDDQLLPSSTSFHNLEKLFVDGCGFLKYLFPPSMVDSFKYLFSLEVRDCIMMEEIITNTDEGMHQMSFPELNYLKLETLPKITRFVSQGFMEFPVLTELYIQNCPKFPTFIFNSGGNRATMPPFFNEQFVSFPKLNNVELYRCNFRKTWNDHLPFSSNSFRNLTKLLVVSCKFLRNLFSSTIAASFEHLSYLEIRNCMMMEEIMSSNRRTCTNVSFSKLSHMKLQNLPRAGRFSSAVFVEFPMLTELSIEDCPEFKTFISDWEKNNCSDMPPLFNEKFVSFPKLKNLEFTKKKLESLELSRSCNFMKIWDEQRLPNSTSFNNLKSLLIIGFDFLESLFSSRMVTSFKHLYSLEIRDCTRMEEIMSNNERRYKMSFPRLNYLKLQNLPKTTTFSSSIFIEFPMLTGLSIHNCPEFKTFISNREVNSCSSSSNIPSLFDEMVVSFPKLEYLELSRCNFVNIWDAQFLLNSTSFCNLRYLLVVGCGFLKNLFSSTVAPSFEQLYSVKIRDCMMMEEIVSNSERTYNMSFPKLNYLKLESLSRIARFSSEIFVEFPVLTELSIQDCPEFKTFISDSEEISYTDVTPPLLNEKFVSLPNLKNLELS
ncbi:uncharacterized protein LOC107419328 [Ziziphus jujuba]|uniref:Uncharacterized protein LOC107419328 n=1 Tax=Ziziphus jujuba TaxID=326968 RepID=A0ABM3IKF3_ZIZJJ|nr:uncharacterized protein LOC107419328 [Ziziphus jujuba]XP_048330318.2 uncharacterized protein LOC107419328 [Ziziphus jujuba]